MYMYVHVNNTTSPERRLTVAGDAVSIDLESRRAETLEGSRVISVLTAQVSAVVVSTQRSSCTRLNTHCNTPLELSDSNSP